MLAVNSDVRFLLFETYDATISLLINLYYKINKFCKCILHKFTIKEFNAVFNCLFFLKFKIGIILTIFL